MMKLLSNSAPLTAMASATLLALSVIAFPASAAQSAKPWRCDESLKAQFKPDTFTTVVAVKSFKRGEALVLTEPANERTARARNDLCMVKLNVGPGNPGPADAPSTSRGIGLEIWLPSPANWNNRIHALGGNGWSGGNAGSPKRISNAMNAADIAA